MASERHVHAPENGQARSSPVPTPAVDAYAVHEQAERILSTPLFHSSKRYSNLLRFIVERSLAGKPDSLKERIIGIEVFGRTADYDTSLDATVRVAATEVRRRLSLYYNEPAHEKELRIDLPMRSYVAEFRFPDQPPPANVTEPRQTEPRRPSPWLIAAAVILVFAVWGLHRLLTPVSAIDRFWAPILSYQGPIAISVGSPPWENPSSAESAAPAGSSIPLYQFLTERQANFPLTDLSTETALAAFLGSRGKECAMRFAQTTTLAELRGQPLILIGGFRNDWAVRLGADLRFQLRQESAHGLSWIEDAHSPANRSWSVDLSAPYDTIGTDYALVTRAFDQSTGNWWIGIAGITGFGSLAAQQMLLDPQFMAALSGRLPKGWERKNLQAVLAIKMVKASPGAGQVVATYSW